MIALQKSDTCFSTIAGRYSSIFNTDGEARTHLDADECRRAFAFDIIKKQSYDEVGRKIPGHYHLVREDTNDIIPSTGIGEKFTPVQHMSIYDYICNDLMPKVPEMQLETVGTLHGCGTGIIAAKIGDCFSIPGDDSPNAMRLMFSNPCNGYGSLVIGFTTVRLFCQNQIAAARKTAGHNGFNIHHTKNAELKIDSALTVIAQSISSAKEIRRKSEFMAKTNITPAFMKRMMDALFPFRYEQGTPGYTRMENKRMEVYAQFDGGETAMSIKGDTAWKLFNAITFPIFNPVSMKRGMDMAELNYSGAVGNRADTVRRIFNTIYSEASLLAA